MKITAVIITYNPEFSQFDNLISSVSVQADAIVIVDNGSSEEFLAHLSRIEINYRFQLLVNRENLGIAAAQNQGIALARDTGADFVVFFDHDSAPAHGMINQLVSAALEKLESGHKVAAVGPRYMDERRNNLNPFTSVKGLKLICHTCLSEDVVVEVDYLIASGSLIPMATFDDVGTMNAAMFIDYIDIEWGLRARSKGYLSYGVCAAKMAHKLGNQPIQFAGKTFPNHTPLRHYYICRNRVYLYTRRWVPLNWKIVDGCRLFLRYGFYSIFAKPQYQHWKMMTIGLLHGLIGRLGKYSPR